MTFLDSVSYLPCSLSKLLEAFSLTASKSWYPHYFNTEGNLVYVGNIPEVSYSCAKEMSDSERREFLAWYEVQRKASVVFDNGRVLESYSRNVVRQVCRMFSREFTQIGKL